MKIFAANWKMHKNPAEAQEFIQRLKSAVPADPNKKTIVFPSATSLHAVAIASAGSAIEFGLQNCGTELKGAFTGENSATVVKDLRGQWVLLGHSERRTLFGETDALIAKKLSLVVTLGLQPMVCIGESLSEREAGKTQEVLQKQLQGSLATAAKDKTIVIAYEPVWAIGTGVVASVDQVRDTHLMVKKNLEQMGFANSQILYGGSVKPDNAKALIQIANVDGFLIGGAALEVESFSAIIKA